MKQKNAPKRDEISRGATLLILKADNGGGRARSEPLPGVFTRRMLERLPPTSLSLKSFSPATPHCSTISLIVHIIRCSRENVKAILKRSPVQIGS